MDRRPVLLACDAARWETASANIFHYWAQSPDIAPLMTRTIRSLRQIDEDPDRLRKIFSSILDNNKFAADIAAATGRTDVPMPVVHFLGDQFDDATALKGTRNLGRVVFADADPAPAMFRLSRYDAIVCASQWNARILRDHGLAEVHVIHEAVDSTLFFRAPKAGLFTPDRFHVFTGGEIGFRVGQDLTLLAFREFARRHDDAVLVTAWRDTDARAAEGFQGRLEAPLRLAQDGHVDVMNWAKANGVDPNQVIDVGQPSELMLAALLREMDCVLQPSRAEGGANSFAMAAMACGTPVIVSRNSGTVDLIDEDNCIPLKHQSPVRGRPGLGTTDWGESDVAEMVQALEALYVSAELRAHIGATGARFMSARTWANHAKALGDLALAPPPATRASYPPRIGTPPPVQGHPGSDLMAKALAHHQGGRLKEAEALYRRIIQSPPPSSQGAAHYNLGVILRERNALEQAVAHFKQAAALRPDHARTFNNLGAALEALGRLDEAESSLRRALALQADYANALYNLGNVLRAAKRPAEAFTAYSRALTLRPQDADTWSNAAIALQTMGEMDQAERHLRQALSLRPMDARLHDNLGVMLEARNDTIGARGAYLRALQIAPNLASAHSHVALLHAESGEETEALAHYRRAIALAPRHALAYNNLGLLHIERGEPDAAEVLFAQAADLEPDYAEAQWNLGLARLAQGQFEAGWQGYEWRLKLKSAPPGRLVQPAWAGENLSGRTILLTTEQGAGDAIQFVRYASDVQALGAKVILQARPELARVLSTAKGVDAVISSEAALPPFDRHAALLSLPRLFGARLDTIRWDGPYLSADSSATRTWRERLTGKGKLRVGLVWRGNPNHNRDRIRSMPAEALSSLTGTLGVDFVSLQLDARREELQVLGGLEDLSASLTDWADTAALLEAMDVVISVDTAVAHLAGALGRPVCLLLPFAPDWRWLLERSDSPWYPSMQLFRQHDRGDWSGPVNRVAKALAERLASGGWGDS